MALFEWFLGLIFIVLVILLYIFFKSRCPSCKKFRVVEQISRIEDGLSRTITSEEWDEKRYKWITYESEAQDYIYTFACKNCGHSWTEKKVKTSSKRRA